MTQVQVESQESEPVWRLSSDLRKAAATLSEQEARFLVDEYYTMQEQRIRSAHQARTMGAVGEPHAIIEWLQTHTATLERQVAAALKVYAENHELGRWAMSICGIGPIIAAGLLAHIDPTVATVGHVWRFAGLDPTSRWEKGEKRPWNASLKCLCWKIGESFVKVSGRPNDIYGKLYLSRKQAEQQRNDAGNYAGQAAEILTNKRFRADTIARAAYEKGRLPAGHLHARAKRWAVKIFLSHYWAVGHYLATGKIGPMPYVIDILRHADLMAPPNMDMIDGMAEAWRRSQHAREQGMDSHQQAAADHLPDL